MTFSLASSLRFYCILIVVGGLSGCQLLNQGDSGGVKIDDLELHSSLKQDAAIDHAISLLENGKTQQARDLIDRVLRINSRHPTALLLVKMLTQPASAVFDTNRFTDYKVKSGDTLGSIVETWLGHSIYFVSVAKLNKIENPTRIFPGMSLKLPVIDSSPLVKRERQRSTANLALLERLNVQKKYLQTLRKLDELFVVNTDKKRLKSIQNNTFKLLANSSVSISSRYKMLEQVEKQFKKTQRHYLVPQYQTFLNEQNQKVLLDEFLLLLEDRSYLDAADKYIKANHFDAESIHHENVKHASEKLVNKLHEEAVVLRKNQKLDEAMTRWRAILEIEPANQLAKKYYSRTDKLINKLKQLN